MSNPLRDEFNAYWIARQRAKGYGTALSDAEMLSHPQRQDAEFESWLEGRRFAIAATESALLQGLHNQLYRAQITNHPDVLADALGKARLLLARYRDTLVPDGEPTAKQKKLMDLANRIDHEELWRWAGMDHDKMTPEQKDRMNAGVALRRYAHLWAPGRWVVFPPEGPVHFSASTLDKAYDMAKHRTGSLPEAPVGHDLYTDADKDRPPIICDSNGQVVLGLCKRCGKGEAELFNKDGTASECKPLAETLDGSWLWGKLMDWCLQRRVAPAQYNDLFAIVDEARKLEKREGDHTI